MSRIQTVFLKELRDLYRDRRTLMVTVVLPLLMYPIIFIGILQITMLQAGKLKEQVGRVALLTPERLPGDFLVSDSTGQLLELTDSIEWQDKLKVGELDAALSLSPGFSDSLAGGGGATITVHYLSSRDFSDQVRRRLEKVADDYQKRVVTSRLDLIGVETAFIHPVALEAVDEASQQEQAGSALGKFLGYLLILTTLSGAFYAAIDLTAGEKERGTLETLLVSPASRKELVYGKFYATLVAALVTAILNLLSMGFTMMYAVRMLDKNEVMGMAISVPSLLLVLLTLIPLAVLFAGATLALAVTARNYKEGQGLLSPMIMVSILPAMVSMVPGIELTPLLAVIPIANVSLLMRSLMSGNTPWLEMTITLVSTGALAMLALRWVTIQFNRESVLFRHAEDVKWSMFTKPVREVGKVLTPTAVALLSAVAVIVVGGAGSFASPEVPFSAILVVQAALAGLAAVWVYRGGYDPVPAFGWRKPALMSFPAVLIALMGGWILTIELATLQHQVFPFPEDLMKQFSDLFAGLENLPLWQSLLLIAVLPAVVEEHLCRGLMLRGLLKTSGKWQAIIAVAAIFAFLHLNPYRFLPTFSLGILLGYIAVRTNSIYPAIFGHFLNNAASAVVFRYSDWIESIEWLNEDTGAWVPLPWLFVGGVLLFVGLYLLPRTNVAAIAPPQSAA